MGLLDLQTKYNPASDAAKIDLPPLPTGYDMVVSFDQALVNTGVATYDGTSVAGWTLRAPKETEPLTGWDRTFARSVALQAKVLDLVAGLAFDASRLAVVYEAPPSGKGKITRPESAILGGHCVEWACRQLAQDRMIGNVEVFRVSSQKAKSLIAGNPKADKAEVRAAMIATYNPQQVGACTNEHERDALANLITWMKG